MGVVQMISRGFHRLGLFLAGYAFLMGFIYSIFFVPSQSLAELERGALAENPC
jgi:hypothetical protein